MENEETEILDNQILVEDGIYVDPEESLDSNEIPELTEQEADELKEVENIEIEQEGGF